jgi:gamma-glutamyltranspeptidase/glutathione hydrolase
MVSCPHALASEAGVELLKAGGSAVDAAIAASAVLSVVYPHMTSVGGDAFWLIWDARRRAVRFLDASGRATASATIEWFQSRGFGEIPLRGIVPATVTVPGAVDGWCQAHDAHGRLALARNLAPAIAYAREGFPVTRRLADWTERAAAGLAENAEAAAIFLPGGAPPRPGQRLRNTDLALTLERIAAEGRAGFYDGDTAREIARYSRARGGLYGEPDFARQRSVWGEPPVTRCRGHRLRRRRRPRGSRCSRCSISWRHSISARSNTSDPITSTSSCRRR